MAAIPKVVDTTEPEGFFTAHPTAFWFFFWGEFAERCSYYGMRAILTLYMTKQLGLEEDNALSVLFLFSAGCYFLPLLGGFVADNYLGKYWTIVGFSLPYIAGQVLIGIEDRLYLAISLILLAMGAGVIKPNISTLMGLTYDQQRPGKELLRSEAFQMFYFAINVGAFLSQLVLPILRDKFGYQIAFLFPAALMGVALSIFAAGKKFYAVETVNRNRPPSTEEEWSAKIKVLGSLMGLFLPVMIFWAVFDQATGPWILFADTYMDTRLFGYTVSADQIQFFNPLFIILILPWMLLFWRFLANRGIVIRPTDKMIVGFVLTAISMGILAYSGYQAGPTEPDEREALKADGSPVLKADGSPKMEKWVKPENKVTIWWQVLAYFVLTVAEILISVTGLELAFVAAPSSMKSFVTACWLFIVGMANLFINVPLSRLYPLLSPGDYFLILTLMVVGVIVVFYFLANQFNRIKAETTV